MAVTEKLILAKALVAQVFGERNVKVLETFKGKKLKGLKYHPLFTFMPPDKPAHFVVLGDFVTTEDGTGLVHMAPAFGAEDMEMAHKHDLPVLMTVLPDGTFVPEVTPWRGMFIKDADPQIVEDLQARGLLFRTAGLHSHLSVLLALPHAADVLRPRFVVHPHQPLQGPPGGAEQHDQLGARARPGRSLRELAREQHRLGAQPRALLGDAAARLGVRSGQVPGMHRLGRGTVGEGRSRSRRRWICTVPISTRSPTPARSAAARCGGSRT